MSTQLPGEPRSVKIQTYGSADSRNGEETMIQQRLFNTDGDPMNYSYIDSGASIPISTCKFIMVDYSKEVIVEAFENLKSRRSHYSGTDQLFNVDVESPSLPGKDTELLYRHVARLIFVSKRTRPDIQTCVASLFTREEILENCYKDIHLDINLLFVIKIKILLMISRNGTFMYFKTLLSKNYTYIQNKLQQIIHSQRLKNIFTVVEGAFKNIVDWIHSNLHIDLTKYMTDSQVYISNDLIQLMNDLIEQEVTSDDIQWYNIHHASILSDLSTYGDIYYNNSYSSYADWKIEKTSEINLKKLEFNINKPKTDLKKIELNINVKDNKIDDINNEEAFHPNDGLANDNNNNIEDHGAQHKQIF